MGFDVRDISEGEHGTTETSEPFDLLIESEHLSFLADVKKRTNRSPINIPIKELNIRRAYSRYSVDDKLVIFHLSKSGEREDCLYISISTIGALCYAIGPYYRIELYQLTPLAGLRKMMEKSCG